MSAVKDLSVTGGDKFGDIHQSDVVGAFLEPQQLRGLGGRIGGSRSAWNKDCG